MATAAKLAPPRNASLDPQLKSWIDNVIVPAMVREFLEQSAPNGSKSVISVVKWFDGRSHSREGHR
jgi:hypothetical protein